MVLAFQIIDYLHVAGLLSCYILDHCVLELKGLLKLFRDVLVTLEAILLLLLNVFVLKEVRDVSNHDDCPLVAFYHDLLLSDLNEFLFLIQSRARGIYSELESEELRFVFKSLEGFFQSQNSQAKLVALELEFLFLHLYEAPISQY